MKRWRKTYTDSDGIRREVTGATEEEMWRSYFALIDNKQAGITASDWADHVLATYKTNVSPKTLRDYQAMAFRVIKQPFGPKDIADVTTEDCQCALNLCAGASDRTINGGYQLLRFVFGWAARLEKIPADPTVNLVKPKGTKRKPRRALTDEERKHFLLVCQKFDPKFRVFELMYYCGCRPSEAMAVTGKDIVFYGNVPFLFIPGTKTENAPRHVPIPRTLYSKIKNTPQEAPVAPNEAGNHHGEESYRRAVKRLKREMNVSMGATVYRNKLMEPLPLAKDFVPYNLRHTFCTDLSGDMDVHFHKELMGHSDIKMTEHYTHTDIRKIANLVKRIPAYQKIPCGTTVENQASYVD